MKIRVWLIIAMSGLSFLSENIYIPSLPRIAEELQVDESAVENTLSIYLLGFSLGVLCWGTFSDIAGRKYTLYIGLILALLGAFGCYKSYSIYMLYPMRFIKAFGVSVCSVVTQSVVRDRFTGKSLSKMYAAVGMGLSIFPAISPFIGGLVAQYSNWRNVFLLFITYVLFIIFSIRFLLPETRVVQEKVKFTTTLRRMLYTKKVWLATLSIGCANGLRFSYYAEGPFYMKMLKVKPIIFSMTFILNGLGMLLGNLLSKKLHETRKTSEIIGFGVMMVVIAQFIFFISVFIFYKYNYINEFALSYITIVCIMISHFGSAIIIGNTLALALVDFKNGIGSASSIFGFSYTLLLSLGTSIMACLHDDTVFPMPAYLLVLSLLLYVLQYYLAKESKDRVEVEEEFI